MSRTYQSGGAGHRAGAEPTGWVGWVFFAGLMMIMIGSFQAIMGLVALFDDGYYLVTSSGLLVNVDYTTWGWIHLILGIVAFFAGFAVMRGQTWGRIIAIVLAVVSAIINLAFLPAYPVWSVLVITLDVIVIYALAVHGGEARAYN